MRTIPDTIDLIKKKLIGVLDCYYSICEKYGGQIGAWAWRKDGATDRKVQVIESEVCRKIFKRS